MPEKKPDHPATEALSLWLLPKRRDANRLQTLITDLATKYHCVSFLPHITIVPETRQNRTEITAIAREVASNTCLFSINPSAFYREPTYFRFLTVRIPDHPTLDSLHQNTKSASVLSVPAFIPHLSLIYADQLPAHDPLLSPQQQSVALKQMTFDRLAVVDVTATPDAWKILHTFRLRSSASDPAD